MQRVPSADAQSGKEERHSNGEPLTGPQSTYNQLIFNLIVWQCVPPSAVVRRMNYKYQERQRARSHVFVCKWFTIWTNCLQMTHYKHRRLWHACSHHRVRRTLRVRFAMRFIFRTDRIRICIWINEILHFVVVAVGVVVVATVRSSRLCIGIVWWWPSMIQTKVIFCVLCVPPNGQLYA